MRVLHLSDTHLTASGIDMDGVDGRAALVGLLHDLRSLEGLDLVVVTGDIADDGSSDGVRMASDLIGAYAEEHGAAVAWTTGNHDDRESFGTVLGPFEGPRCAHVVEVGGLRVITLDSLAVGRTEGVLDPLQLTWLSDVLASPARRGTLLALHHPPIHPPSLPYLAGVGLQDPGALAGVLRGSDVRVVLCGHFHHVLAGSLAGVPVWVGAGVLTGIDRTDPHLERAVLGAGAGLLELPDDGPPTYLPLRARGSETEVYADGVT